jgi:hypothetical protein
MQSDTGSFYKLRSMDGVSFALKNLPSNSYLPDSFIPLNRTPESGDFGDRILPRIPDERGKMVLRHLKRFECTQNTSCHAPACIKIRFCGFVVVSRDIPACRSRADVRGDDSLLYGKDSLRGYPFLPRRGNTPAGKQAVYEPEISPKQIFLICFQKFYGRAKIKAICLFEGKLHTLHIIGKKHV